MSEQTNAAATYRRVVIEEIIFDYVEERATGLTVDNLLAWIGDVYGEIVDTETWESLCYDTHNEIMVLANEADHRLAARAASQNRSTTDGE